MVLPSSQDGDGQALNPTRTLLERARAGDQRAFDLLFQRYHMPLMRWAHGRLCASARGQNETRDVVHICFSKAFHSLDRFVYRHQGSFLGYLHEILKNEVVSMNRRWMGRKPSAELDGDYPDSALRPDEEYEGKERRERYERALASLTPREQELIVMREMGLTNAEIAVELGFSTPNAARMAVTRAIERLAAAIRMLP
ncbi:MAG TPA: sigma-70 family RNA polymerase sigma factor [Candidatus Binatia bacterium]|nr:sigma-70 family RNA polymerase sigma factor [Candidatus Binatia bacterium]